MKAKKLLAGILSAAMVFSSMALPAFAETEVSLLETETAYSGYTEYDLANAGSTLAISAEKAVLKGASSNNVEVTITNRGFSELILNNATGIKSIKMEYLSNLYDYDKQDSGISFKLKGQNEISELVEINGTIIITGEDADAALTVGSADACSETGLGAYRVVINSGNVTAYGKGGRAAIGWWSCLVNINGGTVTATSTGTGAAIGGGEIADGNVKITSGTVTATSTGTGAAIGGGNTSNGSGYVWITGGNVTATSSSGSALGCGKNAGGDGWVVIEGGTINVSSTSGGALLGNRLKENGWHEMTITGGTFTTDVSEYLPEGKMLKDSGEGTYTVEDINEKLANENVTDKEKVETINNVVVTEAVAEEVVTAVKSLPVDKQEEIAPAKVAEIIAAVSEKATDNVVTATNVADETTEGKVEVSVLKSEADAITITKKEATDDEAKAIKLPDSLTAKFFDVKLEKTETTSTSGSSTTQTTPVTETKVPVLLKFYVGSNTDNVKSVFRYHDDVQENLAFDVEGAYILAASNKFSLFGLTFGATADEGSATLTFEEDTTAEEGANVYNIYLEADNNDVVANFESGEFTVNHVKTSGSVGYEIAAADGLTINEVDGVYEIHRTKAAAEAGTYPTVDSTNNRILLGKIELTGAGKGSIFAGNMKMHKHSTDGENEVIDITTVSDTLAYDIAAVKKTLTVNVAFPNAVENQKTDYQDMKITISGGDLAADIVYNLGNNASTNVSWTAAGETATAAYTLTVAGELTYNTAYTVKVEGVGYRTARYTVNMTGAKTLNFWNNVKDTAINVEEGVTTDTTKKNVTFLAGDIVKDNQINIYDLSAVVSYFGTDNLVSEHPEYAKYDLNRDGKIDSKDIAYVLVSWGN